MSLSVVEREPSEIGVDLAAVAHDGDQVLAVTQVELEPDRTERDGDLLLGALADLPLPHELLVVEARA